MRRSVVTSQLDHAQQTWDVQGPASYSFTWRQTCNCTDETSAPIRITVDNEVRADLRTIDGVFATIQDAIDGGAYAVTVEYDTESGLPARVEVDYKHIPDTELLLQISDPHY